MNNEYIIRIVLRARDEMAAAFSAARREMESFRNETRRVQGDLDALNNSISSMTRRMGSATNRIGQFRREVGGLSNETRKVAGDADRASTSVSGLGRSTERSGREANRAGGFFQRLEDRFDRAERSADRLGLSLAGLATRARGLIIVGVLTFAQELTSVLVALGGQLVAVAGSAVQAGGALAGGLAAGAAQAAPVIGTLIGAFQRLGLVMDAVKQARDSSLRSGQEQIAQAKQIQSANEAVRSAEQRLADSHRQVQYAQEALTQARADARRELQDLRLEEAAADLQLRGARLSLAEAERAQRQLDPNASALERRRAALDIDMARQSIRESRLEESRADEDFRAGRRAGVSGSEQVIDARRALADAERDAADASRDLRTAQKNVQFAIQDTAGSVDTLNQTLSQLTGAERGLFRSLQRLAAEYERNFRPITDIIIRSFTRASDRAAEVLNNPRIIRGFTGIGQGIANEIDKATKFLTSPRMLNNFTFFMREAQRNMPIIGRASRDFFEAFTNIARAASPALREILRWIAGIADKLNEWSKSKEGIRTLNDFFDDGVKHLKAWGNLLFEAFQLMMKIFDISSGSGLRSIRDLRRTLEGWGESLDKNKGSARDFFEETRKATADIGRVFIRLGEAIYNIFDAEVVHNFAEFLINVVIPAVEGAIIAVGKVLNFILGLFGTSGLGGLASDIAKWILGITIASRVVGGLGRLLLGVVGTFVRFFAAITRVSGATGTFATATRAASTAMGQQQGFIARLVTQYNALTASATRAAAAQRGAAVVGTGTVIGGRTVTGTPTRGAPTTPRGPTIVPTGGVLSRTGGAIAGGARALGAGALGLLGGPVGAAILLGIFAGPAAINAIKNIETTSEKVQKLTDSAREHRHSATNLSATVGDLRGQFVQQKAAVDDARIALRQAERGTREYRDAEINLNGVLKEQIRIRAEIERTRLAAQADIEGGRADARSAIETARSEIDEILQPALEQTGLTRGQILRRGRAGDASFQEVAEDVDEYKEKIKEARKELKLLAGAEDLASINARRGARNMATLSEEFVSNWGKAEKQFQRVARQFGDIPSVKKMFIETNSPLVLEDLSRIALRADRELGKKRVIRILGNSDNAREAIEKLERALDRGEKKSRSSLNSITGSFRETSGKSGKHLDDLRTEALADLGAVEQRGGKHAKDFKDKVTGEAKDTKDKFTSSVTAILGETKDKFGKSEKEAERRSRSLRRAVARSVDSTQKAVETGFGYIADATKGALETFDAKSIRFRVPKPKDLSSHMGGLAGGGFVGNRGERGQDNVYRVGRGEAVLNWAHQPYVETALRQTYGHGLEDMFKRVRGEHAGEFFNGRRLTGMFGTPYAKGGMVRVPGDPNITSGRDLVNQDVVDLAAFLVKQFNLEIGYAYDPGGGHVSPGHNVTGRAIDIVPGPGGSWNQVTDAVRWSTNRGMTVYYDGSAGSTNLPPHGPGHHAHIELEPGVKGRGIVGGRIPKIVVRGTEGPHKTIAQRAIDEAREAGNKKLGAANMEGTEYGHGVLSEEEVRRIFREAFRITKVSARGGNLGDLVNLAHEESGWNPRAVNRTAAGVAAGLPQGILQVVTDTFNAYKMRGYDDIFNPLHNAIASIRYQMARYGDIQRHAPYAEGGFVGGDGPAIPIFAHEGEVILNHDQQNALGGAAFLRNYLGLKPQPSGSFQEGGIVTAGNRRGGGDDDRESRREFSRAVRDFRRLSQRDDIGINKQLKKLNDRVEKWDNKQLRKIENYIDDRQAALRMDRHLSRDERQELRFLNRAEDRINREQRQRERQRNLRRWFGQEGLETLEELNRVDRELKKARKKQGDYLEKTVDIFSKAIANLTKLGEQMETQFAILEGEMQRSFYRIRGQFVRLTAGDVEQAEENAELAQDRREAIEVMRREARQLDRDIDRAIRRGKRQRRRADTSKERKEARENLDKLREKRDALDDQQDQLEIQYAEALAAEHEAEMAVVQARVDAINRRAERRMGAAERRQRLREAMGVTGGGQTQLFDAQIAIMTAQMRELIAFTKTREFRMSSTTFKQDIRDQIAELEVSIAEATASRFDAARELLETRTSRTMTALDTTRRIVELQGEITGNVNTGQLIAIEEAERQALLQQRAGLQRFLDHAIETNNQEAIAELTQALLENQLALLENTKTINELNGIMAGPQGFTSTAWEQFRQAIFSGEGNVLPQYEIPTAQTGAIVTKTGLVEVHAGEVIKPIPHGFGSGDQINIDIHKVTERVDASALATEIMFRKSTVPRPPRRI